MLTSFADLIALSTDTYSRPLLVEIGPLQIRSGRHPIVSICRSSSLELPFIPNDTDLKEDEQFLLITGINGSGKVSLIFYWLFSFQLFVVDCLHETSSDHHNYGSNGLFCACD